LRSVLELAPQGIGGNVTALRLTPIRSKRRLIASLGSVALRDAAVQRAHSTAIKR